MTSLRVALLGSPRLEHAGQVLALDTRKATALLAYLAVTRERQSRDTLGALLWPDQDREQARGALRRTMSVLRTATGGLALDADRFSVGIGPGAGLDLDVDRFRELARDARHEHDAAGGACARCIGDLTAAARLYRGDFLAGFAVRGSPDFDDWQAFHAQGLRRELGSVLERLALAQVAAGSPAEAVEPARRWLSLDPLHEPAHALLMRLYAQTDQRSAALQQYRDCVGVLDRELGVPPLSETSDLDAAIRAGRRPATAELQEVVPTRRTTPVRRLPLVGRSAELALLSEAAVSAPGEGHLVVVSGEAGIGKSRLLAELPSGGSGRRDVRVRCYEGEGGVAFGVVSDLLRAVLRDDPGVLARIAPDWRSEVARLLPEVAARSLPDLPPLDSPGAQSRFCAALVGALAAGLEVRAEHLPVVVVEDLQWADDSSLDVLAYLVRRLRDVPLLLVLSVRAGALASHGPLSTAVGSALRDGVARIVDLGRLDVAAVAELAGAVLPAPLPPAAAARLCQETGGLPLFVTEYLEAFRRDGSAVARERWTLPGGVRELLLGRLSGLTETTLQVLTAAAVLGGQLSPELLLATSGRGEDELVAALEEATAAGVLLESDEGGGSYAFGQDVLRRLLHDEMSLARRRLLHSRAADALLDRRGGPTAAAALAAHLRLAGREAESAEWSWRAAQDALRLYAHSEALEHLAVATALGHPGHLVHRSTGDALTALGRYREALLAYDRALVTCAAGDRLAAAALEHRLAEVHHRLGEWEVADSHLTAALELVSSGDQPSLRARVLADLALVAQRRGDAEAAAAAAALALHAAQEAADDAALAQVQDVLGVLCSEGGDAVAAEQHLRQSLRHAARLQDVSHRVAALNNLSLVHRAAGHTDDALALARDALQLGLEHGDQHRAAALHTNLADLLHAAGQQDEAREHQLAAARLFAGVDDEQSRRPEIWKLSRW